MDEFKLLMPYTALVVNGTARLVTTFDRKMKENEGKSQILNELFKGCVRVGLVDEKFVINPSRKQLETSPLNLVVSVGPNKNIVMIEGWGDNLEQSKFVNALELGAESAMQVVKEIESMKLEKTAKTDKTDKVQFLSMPVAGDEITTETNVSPTDATAETKPAKIDLDQLFQKLAHAKIYDVLTDYTHDKISRDNALTQIRNSTVNAILKSASSSSSSSTAENESALTYASLSEAFYKHVRKMVRKLALDESKRVDGRKLDEMRPISCRVNMFNSLHGSALFQRGQTQVLCSVTFDSPESMYRPEAIKNMMSPSLTNLNKSFMLHYEFPAFATNEIARVGGRADRREVGHGALAEKALYPMVPADHAFTIRCLCEVLESNGSSSMASVCAGSMALMDAGVALKEHACGVAMGIFADFDSNKQKLLNYKILTDISGFEDYMGDMDFKVAGTKQGITAVQADFKIAGLPVKIIKEIIEKSKAARHKILNIMNKEISAPRDAKKDNQPVLKNYPVPIEKRSKLLGIGGINLKRIYAKTGVTVNTLDETNFSLFAPNENACKEAEDMIKSYMEQSREPELEFGAVYTAKIAEIVAGGLMVQLYPNMKPCLLPNSQLEGRKIVHGSASDFKVGQEIQVKYFGRDPVDGKMRISRKALFKTNMPAQDLLNKNSV